MIKLQEDEKIEKVNSEIQLIHKIDGLTFGTDSFLLSTFVKGRTIEKGCDFGSGTGIIALLLLHRNKAKNIYCVEAQEDFANLIQKNIEINDFSNRAKVLNKDIRALKIEDTDGECDYVVSNPPYMKTTSGKSNVAERKNIARHEVLGDIYDFCSAAFRVLKTGGRFYLVYRPDRLVDCMDALRQNRLEPKRIVFVHGDIQSEPCMVLIEAVKLGKCGLHYLPPLFLYENETKEGKRILTARAREIYRTNTLIE